jgi:hypothetical protein
MSGILKVGGSELINDNGGSGALQWGSGVPAGSVIKTYSQIFRGQDSNATGNYTIVGEGDADELEIVTDTPKSSSSKFLIMVSIGAVSDGSGASTAFRLTRGGTFISESGSDTLTSDRLGSSFRAN